MKVIEYVEEERVLFSMENILNVDQSYKIKEIMKDIVSFVSKHADSLIQLKRRHLTCKCMQVHASARIGEVGIWSHFDDLFLLIILFSGSSCA